MWQYVQESRYRFFTSITNVTYQYYKYLIYTPLDYSYKNTYYSSVLVRKLLYAMSIFVIGFKPRAGR